MAANGQTTSTVSALEDWLWEEASGGSGNTGSNRERNIRKAFVEGDLMREGDLVEAVVLLQEAEEERAEADQNLKAVLARLGLGA